MLLSLALFCTAPVTLFIVKDKPGFLKNIWQVLTGHRSWVGYFPAVDRSLRLPPIRPGILDPVRADHLEPAPLTVHRVNLTYAKDYRIGWDLRLVWRGFAQLDR
ncbi:MAG: hypothetical protein JNM91_00600 [Flavobacteriales bacterium]|nr:hypothetical protein [Flavobacteriales bacterium]